MDAFLHYFGSITVLQKSLWVGFCLSFFFLLEQIIPLVHHRYQRIQHDGVNLFFLSISMGINAIYGGILVIATQWTSQTAFGLLYWIEMPTWLGLVLSFVTLDLVSQYFAHFLFHKVRWMWKIHLVHHTDTKVNFTTGVRHHPIEMVIREFLALTTFILFGMPVSFYLFYRLVTIFFTFWTHANISLPKGLDKGLSYLIITPNAHKFHHHFERPWTDTNFGNVLSIWDRVFGTFKYGDPKQVAYGLDVTDASKEKEIKYQLGLPFNKSIKTD